MNLKKRIRVLVVDDSIVFREVLSRGIASDPNIEVVAMASDPFDARDKIIKYRPDVMTCDVEMPKMNGIEFIKRLMPQYPLPVVVVSTVSEAVFRAMAAGAVDFVSKPDAKSDKSLNAFTSELVIKIKIASAANVANREPGNIRNLISGNSRDTSIQIIAIGASTGGTEAIFSILKCFPESVPGIVIAQHIPASFSRMFADRLDNSTRLKVREARTGDYVERGHVLIAPGDEHMRIKKAGDKYRVECFKGDKVNGHCPSVDVLFESVAKEAGCCSVGVILTGMGYDGARGLLSMKRKGARTIGQNAESSVVYGMPKVAYDIGGVEKQAALCDMPRVIYSMLG
ncbi:two-component system chemotaxis response regulator CheB [Anaerobacterium chartisolvens]|uniref:Protein-glutamate methylesterase/protein-glutamine glutaminase n=1 Tax=Anaerobacterium chartisolvens TaxID=1297424 RepID=A0A369BFY0_9FIRM|nr:chemotaxis response regulator protein-glutamate methylesterase [Anaerobacterium chartisolvens]RCX20165.1 two-component system chemotaxis response regulator CheB [Anaerobacterium chartisolvens]